jgi:hypothetical protein
LEGIGAEEGIATGGLKLDVLTDAVLGCFEDGRRGMGRGTEEEDGV